MKALLISEIFPPTHGGSGRWFWEIYRRLPDGEAVLMVGTHENQQQFDAEKRATIVRVPLHSSVWGIRSFRGIAYYWRMFKVANKIRAQHGIESLHCGRCLPEGIIGLLMKLLFKVPYICYIHGEDIETALLSGEHTLMVKQVFKHASFLIANSRNTSNILQREWNIPESKIKILHPGVDTEIFSPSEKCLVKREMLGWNGKKVVLTVGRLQERKGQDMMIRAMPTILERIPNLLYCIAGDGTDLPRLEMLVRELGLEDKVQFKINLSDESLVACYQQCDLFVLPNRRVGNDIEGFGMVLVEAQACGKPVIAGDSGGTVETMVPSETGFIINCKSYEKLADKVADLLQDDVMRGRMGSKARKHVVERFDWGMLSKQARILFAAL
ncbi:MAG: glycosyltransferase family 4 protein [Pseudomonadota bacterium]|nr:glycosyltransferase family 4 protein [Pseudomonadota bacterium]